MLIFQTRKQNIEREEKTMVTNIQAKFFFKEALVNHVVTDDCVVIVCSYVGGDELTRGHWYSGNILEVINSGVYVIYYVGETTRQGSNFVTVYVASHKF